MSNQKIMKGFCILTMFAAFGAGTLSLAAERSQIPEKLTWNLADLYANEAAWTSAKEALIKRIPKMAKSKGHLGESAESLFNALSTMADLHKESARLLTYASQLSDQDTRNSNYLEMQQAIEKVQVDLGSATSFLRPEILSLERNQVERFVNAEPRLKDYVQFLDDILRWKEHTLSSAEEKVAAEAANLASTGAAVHTIFTNADLPYPEVVLKDGGKVRLDAAAYTKYRANVDRSDRDKVFKAFFGKYTEFQRTLGTSLYAQVKANIFNKDVHKFDSSLQASLFNNNIPVSVYRQLIADVHTNLPTLHRYLKLKQRMLGVKQIRYEDVYAPAVKSVNLNYTPEQSMDLTLKAFAPLGEAYVTALRKGYDSRWVDFLPSTGKRSGAYSNGAAYDVHPYQLLNYMGKYDDMSTLAHESGHTMHSYLSAKNQPYISHDYSIFVAEVASTFNENLLLHYMLENTNDDNVRLSLLGNYLESLRTTLFRQTQFAEFEMKIHEMAEAGQTLTGENLNALYLQILQEYYGDAEGACEVNDLYGVEWAYIPHFYYNFYVYQYATSIVASTTLASRVLAEYNAKGPSAKARDAYIKMLSSGSSQYPIDLLKEAGVDMTTSAPFAAAMAEMNSVMDQTEKILAKKK
jgi:oligoendopeptidase F